MAIPFLQHLDLKSSAELRNALLHKTTSGAAVDAEAGIIYDTGSNTVKYYNGSAWISLTSNTNDYVDGASLSGTDLILTRTGSLSDLTVDLSSLDELVNDTTITIEAGTYLSSGGSFTTNQASPGTITLDHDDTSRTDTTSTDAPTYGGTFDAVTSVTTNAQGHVTAIDVSTVTIPASDNTNTTYGLEIGADGGNGATIELIPSSGTTQVVTIDGVQNQTKITEDLGFDGTIYVGLADDVTIDGLTVNNDVSIGGNLTVAGTTTTLNETVQIVENNTIAFEGTTADAFEVKLTAENATVSDKTATLQNKTGTIALTSDIGDGTITIAAGNALTGGGNFDTNDAGNSTITINHADTSSQGSVNNSGRTYIQDITLDAYGHITGIASATETVVNTNTQLATASALIDVSAMAGNSTASFTHSLGSKNLIVQLYDTNSGQIVAAEVDHTSINAISVIFANTGTQMAANGIGDIRVVVIDAKNGLTDKAVSYS